MNDIMSLDTWIENITSKTRKTADLYGRIINFYKFLELSEINTDISLIDVLEFSKLYWKHFKVENFHHFASIFNSTLSLEEKIRRFRLLETLKIPLNNKTRDQQHFTFVRKINVVLLTNDFDTRFSLLENMQESLWYINGDDAWYVFRWRWSTIEKLKKASDIIRDNPKWWGIRTISEDYDSLKSKHEQFLEHKEAKMELLLSWANIFDETGMHKLSTDSRVTLENLSEVLGLIRSTDAPMPKNNRERDNLVRFIITYFNPESRFLVYDDENNECIDKGMYTLKELIEQGMHLYDDDIPF